MLFEPLKKERAMKMHIVLPQYFRSQVEVPMHLKFRSIDQTSHLKRMEAHFEHVIEEKRKENIEYQRALLSDPKSFISLQKYLVHQDSARSLLTTSEAEATRRN